MLNPYDLSTWRRETGGPASSGSERSGSERSGSEHGGPERGGSSRAEPGGEDLRDDPTEDPREEDVPEDESAYDAPVIRWTDGDRFELARRTVNQSRAAARDRGLFPISAKSQARDLRDRSGSAPGYSGARPDPRDPQAADLVVRRVLGALGWQEGLSSGRVLAEWDEIVGEQLAAHCRPVSLDAGVLIVSATSSAWATQMRMISGQIITRIHEHVGMAVISELRVTGPAAQSWKKGRRTVTWRGPRDTYG